MPMALYRVRTRLPARYNTAIGRLVSRFAVVEGRLRHVIYSRLEVNPKFGRVAVKNPRIRDSFTMIEDLMALREFTTTVRLKGEGALIPALEELERFRDKISHGVWVKHGATRDPVLQVTAGSYTEAPGAGPVKARINPQAVTVPMETFAQFDRIITQALKQIVKLARELGRQHTLLRKQRERLERDRLRQRRKRRQSQSARKPQPKS